MKLDIRDNIKEVTKWTTDTQKKQIPFATMLALNDTAFALHKTYKAQTRQKFDNPTNFTQKGFRVQKAKKTELTADVPDDSLPYLSQIPSVPCPPFGTPKKYFFLFFLI